MQHDELVHAGLTLLPRFGAFEVRGKELRFHGDAQPGEAEIAQAVREFAMQRLRAERTRRLAASDWTQAPDIKMPKAQAEAWRAYRQALRDVPSKVKDPAKPAWPQPPR